MTMISVVIPAYNEEQAIEEVMNRLKKTMDSTKQKYEIIVVNDGSKDKTAEILENISFVHKLNHPHNKGYGAALKTGIKNAKGDWIMITDADGTYPESAIPDLLPHLEHYDMV
ncbi:MAG: glycosyltransferase family 2 protein, partial [Nanoarchaeota archaeon]